VISVKLLTRSASRVLKRLLPGVPAWLKQRKRQRREQAFLEGNWTHDGAISQRRYASYDAYLKHQRTKLATIKGRLEENRGLALQSFVSRFETCKQLQSQSTVLCLGARIGTEVEAFIRLGHFAVGIDLNPGEGNTYVLTGDFHRLVFADGSVDVVYTNCLDHLFDLQAVGSEICRVLKPGGIAIVDIVKGYEEGYVAGGYDATHWARAEDFAKQLGVASGLSLDSHRSLETLGKERWRQAVFRKTPANEAFGLQRPAEALPALDGGI